MLLEGLILWKLSEIELRQRVEDRMSRGTFVDDLMEFADIVEFEVARKKQEKRERESKK